MVKMLAVVASVGGSLALHAFQSGILDKAEGHQQQSLRRHIIKSAGLEVRFQP